MERVGSFRDRSKSVLSASQQNNNFAQLKLGATLAQSAKDPRIRPANVRNAIGEPPVALIIKISLRRAKMLDSPFRNARRCFRIAKSAKGYHRFAQRVRVN